MIMGMVKRVMKKERVIDNRTSNISVGLVIKRVRKSLGTCAGG
jgi:hypothetical protein